MAFYLAISIDFIFTFFTVFRENGNKFFIIFIKGKDILLVNAFGHYVIDFAFSFYSSYPWHKNYSTESL